MSAWHGKRVCQCRRCELSWSATYVINCVALTVKAGGRQAGSLADQFDHRVDFGVGQRGDEIFGGAAGDRVNLHELDLAARGDDFIQPIAKRLLFLRRRRFAVRSA